MVITRITPQIANMYLAKNINNRKLRKSHVDYLANTIRDGKWQVSGSASIKVDPDGNLLDGQHRLAAVVQSGVSVDMYVETGVVPEAFTVIDTGLPRRNSDFYAFSGFRSHPNVIAAAANIVYCLHNGLPRWNKKIPFYQSKQYADLYDIYSSVDFVFSHKDQMRATAQVVSTSILSGFHAVIKKVDSHKADEFITGFIVGANLEANNPILVYRNRLQQMRLSQSSSVRVTQQTVLMMLAKSWNLWYSNETCDRVVVRQDSERPEIIGFEPTPIG